MEFLVVELEIYIPIGIPEPACYRKRHHEVLENLSWCDGKKRDHYTKVALTYSVVYAFRCKLYNIGYTWIFSIFHARKNMTRTMYCTKCKLDRFQFDMIDVLCGHYIFKSLHSLDSFNLSKSCSEFLDWLFLSLFLFLDFVAVRWVQMSDTCDTSWVPEDKVPWG